MDCCTDGIQNLGCFQSCDDIGIGVDAEQSGEYIIEIQPSGNRIFKTSNVEGTPLVFANGFNEDGVSVFKILQPDGEYLTIGSYDCFQITNSVSKNPVLADVSAGELCAIIAGETAEAIDDCLSDEQRDDLIDLICSGGSCDTTYNVYVGGVLRLTGIIDCSVNNTINIYPN